MAQTLAELLVRLGVDSADFRKDMAKAAKQTDSFGKQLTDMAGKAALVAGAATGAFAVMVGQSIDAADAVGKLSEQLGISTEFLSQFQYATAMSNVSQEEMEASLRKLASAAADAGRGLKGPSDAFRLLGVSVKNADGSLKGTEQLLLEMADAFQDLPNSMQKAALAQDLFGRSGANLIPLLNGGADGIRELMEEADQLGLTISQETAAAADQFNDNLDKMQAAVRGVANEAAARLSPTLAALSERMVEGLRSSQAMDAAMKGLEATFKAVVTAGGLIAATFEYIGNSMGATAAAIVTAAKGEFAEAYRILQDGALESRKISEDFGTLLSDIWTETQVEAPKAAAAVQTTMPAAFSQVADTAKKAKEEVLKLDDAAKAAMDLEERLRGEGGALTTSLRNPDEVYNDQIRKLDELYNGSFIDAETRTRALARASEDYYRSMEDLDPTLDMASESMTAFADEAARATQGVLADFLFDPFKDGLEGMVRGFADAMRRIAAERLAAMAANALFGTGQNGNNGWVGLAVSAVSSYFGFGGARAEGGPVDSGKSYLVGENGPELFTPDNSGDIIPNNELAGSMAPGIRIVNAFDTGVIEDYMGSVAGERVVMNAVRRNGTTIRQLAGGSR